MNTKIEWRAPLGRKYPILLILNSSSGFKSELEWHFLSEYMHGATVGLITSYENKDYVCEIDNLLKEIRNETGSNFVGIIFLSPLREAKVDIILRGRPLMENPILASGLEVVLERSGFSYSIEKTGIENSLKNSLSDIKFLEARISDSVLKNKVISYSIDGVNQSKIATVISTIVTFFSGDVDPSLDE